MSSIIYIPQYKCMYLYDCVCIKYIEQREREILLFLPNHCRLYNKESVLMTLLDKSSVPDNAQHLRSLKVSRLISISICLNQYTIIYNFEHFLKPHLYNYQEVFCLIVIIFLLSPQSLSFISVVPCIILLSTHSIGCCSPPIDL